MGMASRYLRTVTGGFMHWCPGCERAHVIMTHSDPKFPGPAWSFDGNVEAPTFNPSVRVTYNGDDAGQVRPSGSHAPAACCHYFLHGGRLQFCGDSTHALAGQTVPLPELPPDWQDPA